MTSYGIGPGVYYQQGKIINFQSEPPRSEREMTGKMQQTLKFNLKKENSYAISRIGLRKHNVSVTIGEIKTVLYCKLLNRHFMQASNQKTPALKRKSRVASVYLDKFEAHPVNRLFSGAGVPLIGMFQGDAFFHNGELK